MGQYLLVGTTGCSDKNLAPFRIEVQNRAAWNSKVSMTEHVWFNFGQKEGSDKWRIYLYIADPVDGSGYSKKINSEVYQIKEDGTEIKFETMEMNNAYFKMLNRRNKAVRI